MWMEANSVSVRVPSAEKVFLKKLPHSAYDCSRYANRVNCKLPAELEEVIFTDPLACVSYAGMLKDIRCEIPSKLIETCGSSSDWICRLASRIGRVEALEPKIDTPNDYAEYAGATRQRVSEIEDRVFFSDRFDPVDVGNAAALIMDKLTIWGRDYSSQAISDIRLKQLILKANDPNLVVTYMNILDRRSLKLDPEFYDILAGRGTLLFKLATHINKRLPEKLESTWEDAKSLVAYTIRFVKQRLPEHLEDVLVGDQVSASEYAFEVVRGFASPRLSDRLHSFMLMKSFQFPEDQHIKRYVAEVDRIAGKN